MGKNKHRHLNAVTVKQCLFCLTQEAEPDHHTGLCKECGERIAPSLVSQYSKIRYVLNANEPSNEALTSTLRDLDVSQEIVLCYLENLHSRRMKNTHYVLTSKQWIQLLDYECQVDLDSARSFIESLIGLRKSAQFNKVVAAFELNAFLKKELDTSFGKVFRALGILHKYEIKIKGSPQEIRAEFLKLIWDGTHSNLEVLKKRSSDYHSASRTVLKAEAHLRSKQIKFEELVEGRSIVLWFSIEPESSDLLLRSDFGKYCSAFVRKNTEELERLENQYLGLVKVASDFKITPLVTPKTQNEMYASATASRFAAKFFAEEDFSQVIESSAYLEEFADLCQRNAISLFQFCANLILLLKSQPTTRSSITTSVAGFLLKTEKELLGRIIAEPVDDWERKLASARISGAGNVQLTINPYQQVGDSGIEREFINTKMSFRPHNSWKRRNT